MGSIAKTRVYNFGMRPNQELVPDHGFYVLCEKGKAEVGGIAICLHPEKQTWGYWYFDQQTQQKEWRVVDVPEQDPTKIVPRFPYTGEELLLKAEVGPLAVAYFEWFDKEFVRTR